MMTTTTTLATKTLWTDADLTPDRVADRIMGKVMDTLHNKEIHGDILNDCHVAVRPAKSNRSFLGVKCDAYYITITFAGEDRFAKHRRAYFALMGLRVVKHPYPCLDYDYAPIQYDSTKKTGYDTRSVRYVACFLN